MVIQRTESPSNLGGRFDICFHNCRIQFPKKEGPSKGWMVLRDGRIEDLGVGDLPGYKRGSDTLVLDLHDAIVLPAMCDAHMHLYQWSFSRKAVDLSKASSLEEMVKILKQRLKEPENDPFISSTGILLGVDYDESFFHSPRRIDRKYLDEIFPNDPVVIRRICGHKAVVNNEAMKILGSSMDIPENGILIEDGAMGLSWKIKTPEVFRLSFVEESVREIFSMGIVGGVDIIPEYLLEEHTDIFRKMGGSPDLAISIVPEDDSRVKGSMKGIKDWDDGLPLFNGSCANPNMVSFSKFFLDGSIGARTASFHKDYIDGPSAGLLYSKDELIERIFRSHQNGLVPMVHVIGDRATGMVLDLVRELDGPIRLEHAEGIRKEDLCKLNDPRIALCLQPNFQGNWGGEGGLYEQALGPGRFRLNRFRDILDNSVHVCFGSDMMPVGPMYGIMSAMRHQEKGQSLTFSEALRSYTEGSFRLSGLERNGGNGFHVGSSANIAVYLKDSLRSFLTIKDGRIVYKGSGSNFSTIMRTLAVE